MVFPRTSLGLGKDVKVYIGFEFVIPFERRLPRMATELELRIAVKLVSKNLHRRAFNLVVTTLEELGAAVTTQRRLIDSKTPKGFDRRCRVGETEYCMYTVTLLPP